MKRVSDAMIQQAEAILPQFHEGEFVDAMAAVEKAWGRFVGKSTLCDVFRRAGLPQPSTYLQPRRTAAERLAASAAGHVPPARHVGDPRSVSDRRPAGTRVDDSAQEYSGMHNANKPVDNRPVGGLDQNGQLEPRVKSEADDDPYAPPPVPTIADLGAAERDRRTESDARRDLRRTLAHVDELEKTIKSYERYTAEPIRPVRPTTLHGGKRPAAAVALLSDVHAEESVMRTDAIRNEYSLKIAERRVSRFFAGVVWLIKHAPAFDIDTLVLWLGGDLISGDIHDELLERCEIPPAEATLVVRDWIVAGLRSVLAALPEMRIVVPCSCGNHSRTTQKMRAATGYGHSWEWLLFQVLGHDFKDEPRIQFHATRDEMQYVDVHGFTLAFHHGHRMKYNGGIGGITIPAIKAMHRWEQWRACDFYHFGHFHTRIDLGQIAFNGSVIGPSPYGFAIGAAPEPPQQSFYILDSKRGKTMSSPVWVAE